MRTVSQIGPQREMLAFLWLSYRAKFMSANGCGFINISGVLSELFR